MRCEASQDVEGASHTAHEIYGRRFIIKLLEFIVLCATRLLIKIIYIHTFNIQPVYFT